MGARACSRKARTCVLVTKTATCRVHHTFGFITLCCGAPHREGGEGERPEFLRQGVVEELQPPIPRVTTEPESIQVLNAFITTEPESITTEPESISAEGLRDRSEFEGS